MKKIITFVALALTLAGCDESDQIKVDPDEKFIMGNCVTSQNIEVSLNELLDRNRFRTVDCLELLWVWEDPEEDEIVHLRAEWLRNNLCLEIYGTGGNCEWEPWEPVGFQSREEWLDYLRHQISAEKREWLQTKTAINGTCTMRGLPQPDVKFTTQDGRIAYAGANGEFAFRDLDYKEYKICIGNQNNPDPRHQEKCVLAYPGASVRFDLN